MRLPSLLLSLLLAPLALAQLDLPRLLPRVVPSSAPGELRHADVCSAPGQSAAAGWGMAYDRRSGTCACQRVEDLHQSGSHFRHCSEPPASSAPGHATCAPDIGCGTVCAAPNTEPDPSGSGACVCKMNFQPSERGGCECRSPYVSVGGHRPPPPGASQAAGHHRKGGSGGYGGAGGGESCVLPHKPMPGKGGDSSSGGHSSGYSGGQSSSGGYSGGKSSPGHSSGSQGGYSPSGGRSSPGGSSHSSPGGRNGGPSFAAADDGLSRFAKRLSSASRRSSSAQGRRTKRQQLPLSADASSCSEDCAAIPGASAASCDAASGQCVVQRCRSDRGWVKVEGFWSGGSVGGSVGRQGGCVKFGRARGDA